MAESKTETSLDRGRLGTFSGVFTPSILTILGIILFLRLGYVTGSAGVARTLLIVAIANLISLFTSQSLAAIATNLRVKGGGDYYLISRTLGVAYGGAIGIVLYLAQSVSVAFYCIGFAEAVVAMSGAQNMPIAAVALVAAGTLFGLAWLGADWATKFQYLVMGLLAAALFSFFSGGLPQWETATFAANWEAPPSTLPFWVLFGIFFPAVTGFTQGVSMSGDLRDPGKSLPLGTFGAVWFSICIYFAVVVVFAGVMPNQVLVDDYQAMQRISRYSFLIDAGVIAATLSSAMASFLGGPRILQSLATDKIFPFLNMFAKGSGVTNNPRRAILLTSVIASITIGLGQLNMVARIVSMFFLISYGLLNYATWIEAHGNSPSFRPRFRWFNKYFSFAGCLLCGLVILALDLEYGLIAGAILFAIHQYLKRQGVPAKWADSSRSFALEMIRRELQVVQSEPEHDRDWRPHLLVFSKNPSRRNMLLHTAQWLSGTSGLGTVVTIVEETGWAGLRRQKEAIATLRQAIAENQTTLFPLVIGATTFPDTLRLLLQSYGLGPLKANSILCNWYGEDHGTFPSLQSMKFGHNLRYMYRLGYNLLILHGDPLRTEHLFDSNRERTIDIWYRNDASGQLMLLLAYLLTRNALWKKSAIRVLIHGDEDPEISQAIQQELDAARIPAIPVVVQSATPEEIITHSTKSDLVFLPFRFQEAMITDLSGFSMERVLTQLPPVLMVMAAREIDLDAEPEEGKAGELGHALDELLAAEHRVKKSVASAKEKADLQETLRLELSTLSQEDSGFSRLQKKLQFASDEAEKSQRKAAKDQSRLEIAQARVKDLQQQTD